MDDDRLADRAALQELKASYFRYLDTKRWASWRQIFTDDMVFYNDAAPVPTETQPMTTSGDDFVEMVSTILANAVTVHQGHMPELRFTDARNANGVWAMFDWVDSSGSGGRQHAGLRALPRALRQGRRRKMAYPGATAHPAAHGPNCRHGCRASSS